MKTIVLIAIMFFVTYSFQILSAQNIKFEKISVLNLSLNNVRDIGMNDEEIYLITSDSLYVFDKTGNFKRTNFTEVSNISCKENKTIL
jgi:hypothetical protein